MGGDCCFVIGDDGGGKLVGSVKGDEYGVDARNRLSIWYLIVKGTDPAFKAKSLAKPG